MKLEKAIEILDNYPPGTSPDNSLEFNQAIQLSVEAAKEVICLRSTDRTLVRPLLPGETKD